MESPLEQFVALTAKKRDQYEKVKALRVRLQQEEAKLDLLDDEIQIISDKFRKSSEQLLAQDKRQNILRLLQQGYKQREIAEMVGVVQSYVAKIKSQFPDLFKTKAKLDDADVVNMGDFANNYPDQKG